MPVGSRGTCILDSSLRLICLDKKIEEKLINRLIN